MYKLKKRVLSKQEGDQLNDLEGDSDDASFLSANSNENQATNIGESS